MAAILIVALLAVGSMLSRDGGGAGHPQKPLVSAVAVAPPDAGQSDDGPDIAFGDGGGDNNAAGSAATATPKQSGTATYAPTEKPLSGGATGVPVPTPMANPTQRPASGLTPTPKPTPVTTAAPIPVPIVTVVSPVGGGWTIDRTLTWSYNANGGPAQAAVYVQIDTHPTFTAVDTWQSQWFSLSSSGCTIPAGVDLVGGTTYYWRVLANNGQTNSDWSASGSFRWATVPTATPVSPVNGARATSRVLTWAYNANGGPGQGGFILQISTHSDFGAIDIVDTGFTSSPYSSWTMPDGVWLANGTTFYWRVTVENDETGTPWSSTASFVWGG